MKALARAALVLGAVYVALSAALYAVILQPPAVISQVFARVHWTVFAALPMERLWLRGRSGKLAPGQEAPDFDLATMDRKSRVRLSSFRGAKPVVLVFGSYT